MTVLVIAEHDNHVLKPSTLTTVTAAATLSAPVHLLVAGHQCEEVAAAASRTAGVERIIHIEAEHYRDQLAEELTPMIAGLANAYTHLLGPATTFGKDLLPRVAAVLDVAAVSDIIAIKSDDTFVRPIYAGNVLATVQATDPIRILTVRTTAFAPAAISNNPATIVQGTALPVTGLSSVIDQQLSGSERPELTVARVVISGGRGLGSADNFRLLEQIADRLGGAVGGSRAAVDAGYIPNDFQIGQTGKIVAPELYIAVGISGAIQHLAGMKDSRVIVAINNDADAPIFEVADYGLAGDLFKILPDLLETLNTNEPSS